MKKTVVIVLLLVLSLSSCQKEFEAVDFTEVDIEVQSDNFYDTLYRIRNINVATSNNQVLDHGYAAIKNGEEIIIEGEWKSLIDQTFSLPERKIYFLDIEISENKGDTSLAEETFEVDNRLFPKSIELESISLSQNVLNDTYDGMSVSPSHMVNLEISNSVAYYGEEEFEDHSSIVYFNRNFPPESTVFNFTNTTLPVRHYSQDLFKRLDLYFYYPLVYNSNTVIDTEYFQFQLEMEQLYEENETLHNTTYTHVITVEDYDDTYTATINYQWVYE